MNSGFKHCKPDYSYLFLQNTTIYLCFSSTSCNNQCYNEVNKQAEMVIKELSTTQLYIQFAPIKLLLKTIAAIINPIVSLKSFF
jgi:hypothetical protein